jgi:hypothetical protein
MAGLLVAENAVTKNLDVPLYVEDHDSYWIIPARTVQAVRVRDPTFAEVVSEPKKWPLGFDPARLMDGTR